MRIYRNPNQASPIKAIIVEVRDGFGATAAPKVLINPEVLNHNYSFIFKPFHEASRQELEQELGAVQCYVAKPDKRYDGSDFIATIYGLKKLFKILIEANLTDAVFTDEVWKKEEALYLQTQIAEKNRRTYERPDSDTSVIDAFIVELWNDRYRSFIRIPAAMEQAIYATCSESGLGWDSVRTEFESLVILSGPIPTVIKKLGEAGLMSESFKEAVYAMEVEIPNIRRRPEPEVLPNHFKEYFTQLEESVASLSVIGRTGMFSHSLSRPFREIKDLLAKIRNEKVSTPDGLNEIIRIAKRMGNEHQITRAANKCLGAFGNLDSSERERSVATLGK